MIPEGSLLRAKIRSLAQILSQINPVKIFPNISLRYKLILSFYPFLQFSSCLFPSGCNNYWKINYWDVGIFKIYFVLDENKADLLLATGLRMCGAIPLLYWMPSSRLQVYLSRPEESYRLWCFVVCDLETSRMGAPCIYIYIYIYIWH